MDKKALSERDICSMFIGPAIEKAGWDKFSQIRKEVAFTKGRVIVRGRLVTRGKAKRADYVLYIKPNIPLALVEAKDNTHAVGDGMKQALDYATTLNIPFVFASNGDAFLFHDRTGAGTTGSGFDDNERRDLMPTEFEIEDRERQALIELNELEEDDGNG